MSLLASLIIFVTMVRARDTVLQYVPVVMLGYDVVAYHLNVTGCNSILGTKQYSYQLNSTDTNGIARLYEFWFADQNNLNIFISNPWKYAPKFGGFCSWGTCCEKPPDWPWSATFQGPPAGPDSSNCGFRIHTDGYLYFNIWQYYDSLYFGSNADQHIADGEARWIQWYGSLQAGPFNHYCFSTIGHETINDCVYNAQRHAPAANQNEEIYPIDSYVDPYFTTTTANPSDKPTITDTPTAKPTDIPRAKQTDKPIITDTPTEKSTDIPTVSIITNHTANPSEKPTDKPTAPTSSTTAHPTVPDTTGYYVPIVLLGYDVVAYHLNVTGCNSIMGKEEYAFNLTSADGNGIDRLYQFWFADENNLRIFASDPWRYAPRNGGFCSWGTCCEKPPSWPWSASFLGPPAGPDPAHCGFRIHTNTFLYFNIWKGYDDKFFNENADQHIADAETRWIEWFGSLKAGIFNHQCFSTPNNFGKGYCTSTPQSLAPAVNSTNYNDKTGHSSNKSVIELIIGICVAVGIVVGIIGIYVLYRYWKNTKLIKNFVKLNDEEQPVPKTNANGSGKQISGDSSHDIMNMIEGNDVIRETQQDTLQETLK